MKETEEELKIKENKAIIKKLSEENYALSAKVERIRMLEHDKKRKSKFKVIYIIDEYSFTNKVRTVSNYFQPAIPHEYRVIKEDEKTITVIPAFLYNNNLCDEDRFRVFEKQDKVKSDDDSFIIVKNPKR